MGQLNKGKNALEKMKQSNKGFAKSNEKVQKLNKSGEAQNAKSDIFLDEAYRKLKNN